MMIVPDLSYSSVLGQSDKSFKGNEAPFVPPSPSERLGSLSINGFEFDDDGQGDGEGGIDRDELPLLTQQEIDEFLSDDIDDLEQSRLTVLGIKESFDDPISSIVEEIVKNETLIHDEEIGTTTQSQIKFREDDIEQLIQAQQLAPEPENQTTITTNATDDIEVPLNATEDDFEIEEDEISLDESPTMEVIEFVNQTTNLREPLAPTADNETAVTGEEEILEEEEQPLAPTADNETAVTGEEEILEEEEQPSELLQTNTEEVEEELPNTAPTAQDVSVTTSQNQQLNIKLNAQDADGDKLSFTIVDEPTNGQLGNIKSSSNTVTYTPDDDYSGQDAFTFIVNDGTTNSDEATVSITVEEAQEEVEEADEVEENEVEDN